MKIKIKPTFDSEFELIVEQNEKIENIKSKIYEKIKLEADSQLLTIQSKILEDNKTLLDYFINEGTIITLYNKIKTPKIIIENEKINIQYDKKNIQLNFNENETILKLKEKINEKIHVPTERQILIFNKNIKR